MKSPSLTLIRLGGLASLSLFAACFVGCQGSTGTGEYEEYSAIEGEGSDCPSAAIPPGTYEPENQLSPAIAEKPPKSAIDYIASLRSNLGSATTVIKPAEKSGAIAGAKTAAPPREIKLLIPDKTFKKVGPEEAVRVSYDDVDLLKVLNMDPVPVDVADYLPGWLEQLDGRRIRIRGFMMPAFQDTHIPYFVLARDNQICCFGRNPKRYDVIDVVMRKGVTTDYIQNRPFDVVGIFRIQPESNKGKLYQLYVIEDATVIP